MNVSTVLLKTPVVLQLPSDNVESPALENCVLTWEQDALVVNASSHSQELKVPALKNQAWLQSCLRLSPIHRVYLDQSLDYSAIKSWLDICNVTKKQAYLKLRSANELARVRWQALSDVKRGAEFITTFILLILLSPVIVISALFIRLDSRGPILFRQWRVGHQGRLFQVYRFRSTQLNARKMTRVGYWLKKLRLDGLPQLFNVLEGKVSLIGPKPWTLGDAVQVDPSVLKEYFNALPGLTNMSQGKPQYHALKLATASQQKFR